MDQSQKEDYETWSFLLKLLWNNQIVCIAMVAFARAKAKSIFSKLLFTQSSKIIRETYKRAKNEDLCDKKERTSNYFLEAIKSGGIWLS